MSHQKKIRWLYLALAACLCGVILSTRFGLTAPIHAAGGPDNPVIFSEVSDSIDSVVQYWTPKRMASALSADVPAIDEKMAIPRAAHRASARPAALAQHALPSADPTNPLYQIVGKVFFSNNGRDFVCSGTIVASLNRSLVDTAGHCVVSNKHFVSNWIFCPVYTGNGCHFYVARVLATNKSWLDHSGRPDGWYGDDLGMAVVAPANVGGKKLADAFGSVSGLANLDYATRTYVAVGYPAAPPFTGKTQLKCTSPIIKTDDNQNNDSPLGIACDMTGGSSGGGWFIAINNQLYLNGHTSYGYNNDPGVLYSPYFGDSWLELFRATQVIAA